MKLAAFAVACIAVAGSASAQTPATGNLTVSVTFNDYCSSVNSPSINFPNQNLVTMTAALTHTATITVACTVGTTYDIALGNGSNFNLGPIASTRAMANGTNYISYNLLKPSTAPWGSGGDVLSGTATSTSMDHVVTAEIPIQTIPSVGTYSDTVAITVTY